MGDFIIGMKEAEKIVEGFCTQFSGTETGNSFGGVLDKDSLPDLISKSLVYNATNRIRIVLAGLDESGQTLKSSRPGEAISEPILLQYSWPPQTI